MMIGVLGISGETCLSASSDLGPEKKSELTIIFLFANGGLWESSLKMALFQLSLQVFHLDFCRILFVSPRPSCFCVFFSISSAREPHFFLTWWSKSLEHGENFVPSR